VFWDITREVKRRFDAEGIGIPYPQQDVHLHLAGDAGALPRLMAGGVSGGGAETGSGPSVTRDGGLDDGGLDDRADDERGG
jgi:hypothetical protein